VLNFDHVIKEERTAKFCEKCGTKINEGALFCGGCGSSVETKESMEMEIGKIPSEVPKPILKSPELGIGQKKLDEVKINKALSVLLILLVLTYVLSVLGLLQELSAIQSLASDYGITEFSVLWSDYVNSGAVADAFALYNMGKIMRIIIWALIAVAFFSRI